MYAMVSNKKILTSQRRKKNWSNNSYSPDEAVGCGGSWNHLQCLMGTFLEPELREYPIPTLLMGKPLDVALLVRIRLRLLEMFSYKDDPLEEWKQCHRLKNSSLKNMRWSSNLNKRNTTETDIWSELAEVFDALEPPPHCVPCIVTGVATAEALANCMLSITTIHSLSISWPNFLKKSDSC